MDKTKLLILAGIFARSNMGQGLPTVEQVRECIKYPPKNANSAACWFCEQFMETDEHEKMFEDEVKMWVKLLENPKERELYQKSSPDVFALYDSALTPA